MKYQLNEEKNETSKQFQELKNKVIIAEERAKDAERKNILMQSEFEKKQVLLA